MIEVDGLTKRYGDTVASDPLAIQSALRSGDVCSSAGSAPANSLMNAAVSFCFERTSMWPVFSHSTRMLGSAVVRWSASPERKGTIHSASSSDRLDRGRPRRNSEAKSAATSGGSGTKPGWVGRRPIAS